MRPGLRAGHLKMLVQVKMRSTNAPRSLSRASSAACTASSSPRVIAPRPTSGWLVQIATATPARFKLADRLGGAVDQRQLLGPLDVVAAVDDDDAIAIEKT